MSAPISLKIWLKKLQLFMFRTNLRWSLFFLTADQSVKRLTAEREVAGSIPGRDRTNTKGLIMTEKWEYCLCPGLQMARPSRGSDDHVKWNPLPSLSLTPFSCWMHWHSNKVYFFNCIFLYIIVLKSSWIGRSEPLKNLEIRPLCAL